MTIYNEEMRRMVQEIEKGEQIVREFFAKTGRDLSYYKKEENPYAPYDPNGFLLIWRNGVLKVSFSGLFAQEIKSMRFQCSKKLYLGLVKYLKRIKTYECYIGYKKNFCVRFI